MSRGKMPIYFLLLLTVAGCSLMEPYVDRRRDAGQPPEKLYVGRSKPDAPAICYNSLITDFSVVQKLADEECVRQKTGLRAAFVDENVFSCALLNPTYANFKCVDE